MKVKAPARAASTATEYFLYAIVIIQTAVAAIAYKTMSQNAVLWPSAILYLSVIYFGVLGWVFYQLNRLHRRRREAAQANAGSPVPEAQPSELASAGLPPAQVALSASVRMESNTETAAASVAVTQTAPARVMFGITYTKLAIVLLVFGAALKAFSWALANLLKP